LRAGQLVSATKGRDRGRFYLVYGLEGTRVLLVDGSTRTRERPKKKNCRHVRIHPGLAGDLAGKFVSGARVDNAEIKRALAELIEGGSGEGGRDG